MKKGCLINKSAGLPEFCPNPLCIFHDRAQAQNAHWFHGYGSYYTKARGTIQRFICIYCRKTCSTQTFSIHYWTHITVDIKDLDDRFNCCSGYRQIGRALSLSYRVLKNRSLRLARNYLNLFDCALANFNLPEDIAFDGFESYLRSQYIPDNFNIAVGCTSRIPYAFTLSLLRRKGAMTDIQKQNRAKLDAVWRPKRHALVDSCKIIFREVLSLYMNRKVLSPFVFHTDEKKEYRIALKELPEWRHLSELNLVSHTTISSRAARTRNNPLFPVNYLDREIRKNCAAHARETVRGDREASMTMSRMAIVIGHHTFRKPFCIDSRASIAGQPTHADKVHLLNSIEAKNAFERLYTHRHLWAHQKLHARWMEDIWQRKTKNPPIVNFVTGAIKQKGQPGNGWFPQHLIA